MSALNMSDDQLMDHEANALHIIDLWNSMPENIRAESILSDNPMHQAYTNAKEIIQELNRRINEEIEDLAQCQ